MLFTNDILCMYYTAAILYYSGFCEASGATLPSSELSEEEFKRLEKAIEEKLIVTKNIYETSTPKEWKR